MWRSLHCAAAHRRRWMIAIARFSRPSRIRPPPKWGTAGWHLARISPVLEPHHKPSFKKAAFRCITHELAQCGQSVSALQVHQCQLRGAIQKRSLLERQE
jgi:hypothetical protein